MRALAYFEPHATECSNPHRVDYWTCPGCYHDLGNIGAGTHWCASSAGGA